jgi:starch synthase (maltosyl-transferring)
MYRLAKIGFTQSYTYFTWRTHKQELTDYLIELTQTNLVDYFRPNFFTNTQDILTEYLQLGGLPAFKIRLALAAFLSPSYGIYSGFEFCENIPLRPGSEEYLDSEKYELRHRDFSREEDTLIPYVRKINQIRRDHPALGLLANLRFLESDNDKVLAFSKGVPGHAPIQALVSLDPTKEQEASIWLDIPEVATHTSYRLHELISGTMRKWRPEDNRVLLDPSVEPALIFTVEA